MKPTALLLICLIGLAIPSVGLAQPTINTHPKTQSVLLGGDATFSVVATGTTPLAYQWQKDSVDLAGRTEATLVLTNVQSSHAGDYRVVVTDSQAAVTSDAARLTVLSPPAITPVGQPKDKAVAEGRPVTISVTANGTGPLSCQWRFEGAALQGATNRTLSLPRVQLTNAGAYTVEIGNLAGSVTSQVAQLSVAQGSIFTNAQGKRLAYRLFSPLHYEATKKYPLVLFWHGIGESGADNLAQLTDQGQFVFLSATNQSKYPCFYLAPQIPATSSPSFSYYRPFYHLGVELLAQIQAQYNIDADRLYVTGLSVGGYNTWNVVAEYPNLFAAAVPMSGGWVTELTDSYPRMRVPVWNFHANNDGEVSVSLSDAAISTLRNAGRNPIYTRYQTGGHSVWPQAYSTPGLVDWMMAQVKGAASSCEPLLAITNPTQSAVYSTNSATLELGGTAMALGQPISNVSWTNLANNADGRAFGTSIWNATGIPIQADKSNRLIVTATTTSWAPHSEGTQHSAMYWRWSLRQYARL